MQFSKNTSKRPAPGTTFLSFVFLSLSLLLLNGCHKVDQSPPDTKDLDLQLIADNLVSPLTAIEAPDGSHRLYVVDQSGQIWIIDQNGQKPAQPFIDISSKMVSLNPFYDERGLISLAFHPRFNENGKFYLFY